MALELGFYTGDGPIQHPLSLNDGPISRSTESELRGLHKDYIEALRANLSAREEFEGVAHNDSFIPKSTSSKDFGTSTRLEEQLAISQLRRKHRRLTTVQTHLKYLCERSVGNKGLTDGDQSIQGEKALPSIPSTVINSFVAEQCAGAQDVRSRVDKLEKTVLQTNLRLKQEERLVSETRARCQPKLGSVGNSAKLQALHNTRSELIGWIEAELSKASMGQDDLAGEQVRSSADETSKIPRQLQQIQEKYNEYVSARKSLLRLMSQSPELSIPSPDHDVQLRPPLGSKEPPAMAYLFNPHIQALVSQSRQQRALITHKTHVSAAMRSVNERTCQELGHLAQESQMLSAYPIQDSARRRSGTPGLLSAEATGGPDIANRIKAWVFSFDAAKIATLEAVAEQMEVGQLALENSMKVLDGLEVLFGVEKDAGVDETNTPDGPGHAVNLDAGSSKKVNVQGSPKKSHLSPTGDPWSMIQGNLGLIGHDTS